MIIALLPLIVAISAVLAIYFRLKNNTKYYGVMKAITTSLIILIAVVLNAEHNSEYGWLIITGLILSLVGDMLLLKESLFVQGLLAFLLAHIVFTYAFSSLYGFQTNEIVLGALLLAGGLYLRFLLPHLKSFAIPVALYVLAIIVMDWQAIGLSISGNGNLYLLGVGAILFTFSDAVIAYNKFVKSFKSAELLILSTYWAAIFLISVSIKFV